MPSLSSGGSSFLQDLAKLTWTFADVGDSNDTYVTLFDVTGSGIVTGFWAFNESGTHLSEFKLTIDGVVVYVDETMVDGVGLGGMFPLSYFGVSAKLEMRQRAGGASTAKYYGVVGVQ